jgi:replicative DNA helicase
VSKRNDSLMPPHNIEPEKIVLGSMLRDNSTIGDLLQIVRPGSFYRAGHQTIFAAILDLYDRGDVVDTVTLAELLKQRGQIDDIGGYVYLNELQEAAPTGCNAETHARIVRENAVQRWLIIAGNKIVRDAQDHVAPADEMLEQADRTIIAVAQDALIGQAATLAEQVLPAYDRIDERSRRRQEGLSISGLPTGFIDLDDKTGGLQNSEEIVIAARPSAGKTALLLCMARHIVVEEHLPVFIVSLEQTTADLTERLLCCEARVDTYKVRAGLINDDDARQLREAGKRLREGAVMLIDDTPAQGMLRIAANARRFKLRHQIRAVFIDYLQLIEPDNRRDNRQEQVAGISTRLKQLARELKIPVVAMAQLNREQENRPGNRPRLADVRESGKIEADADVVMLLHRPELYENCTRPDVVDVIVAKQRNGPTGDITLTFRKKFMRFENYVPECPNEMHADRTVSTNGVAGRH